MDSSDVPITQDSKVVMLVEDEESIRELYSEVLRKAGYKTIEAENGKVAVKISSTTSWDLMLLDIMMPELDGVGVLRIIKQSEELKNKPVIILTNLGNENLITECFTFGVEGYLIKAEITPDKIIEEVKNFI